MLTTRAAHALLSAATTPEGLRALARALGFTGHRHVLGHRAAEAIGLPAARASRIVRDECTAALLIEDLDPDRWRESIQRVATHLDRLADARRWLIIAHCASDGPVVLACWLGSIHGPRVAVLRTTPRETLDSDAQTVAALAAAWHPDPTLTCLRWHELLGRHAIGKRFFREVHGHVAAIAEGWPARVHPDDRRTLALVHVARLLFLKFLETKGWLNGDRAFLAKHAEHALEQGGALWQRLIAPLTFGTLNTPQRRRADAALAFGEVPFLNGGLFACSPVERRARRPAISDALLAPLLLDTLARFRFTAREEARSWSEAAIDPDLLGRTFEAMMDGGERRLTGTFYTPARLVSTLVDDALEHALRLPRALVRDALDGQPVGGIDARRLREHIASLRVLDPACGSGGLLVATLERLAGLRQSLGDTRPIAVIRREILTQSIFGVDIAPMAVWLCELRLWLSIVIDDESPRIAAISPLPNLDHHIRIGDALGPHAFDDSPLVAPSRRLVQLRTRYTSSTGAKKEARAARIDQMERECATRLAERALSACRHERAELLRLARQPTLFADRHGLDVAQRRRLVALRGLSAEHRRALRRLHDGGSIDFDFRTHFSDAAVQGGFDLVIGNPPWVRSHHLDAATRAQLRSRFASVTRRAGEPAAFGVQTDIVIPFTQRGLSLTRPGGILAFLLPAKLWRSVSAGSLRQYLLDHSHLCHLRDQSGDSGGFSAAVYPSTLVTQRASERTGAPTVTRPDVECHATDATGTPQHFSVVTATLPADARAGAPWRVVPAVVRAAADVLGRAGGSWMESVLPPPSLGIKTGCNDAYLIGRDVVPPAMRPWVRPVIRGDQVRAWQSEPGATALIVPCDKDGQTLKRLPAALSRHFAGHERALRLRTDLRPREPWWTLFRTELLGSAGWRVVWADIGLSLRACVLAPNADAVPLNTCYGVRLKDPVDAHALVALLNAPTTTAWLSLVAEPARGGYLRFMGWTVLALPIPPWERARTLLAPIAARARRGEPVDAESLHRATLESYGISHADIAPLLEWTGTTLRDARMQQARVS